MTLALTLSLMMTLIPTLIIIASSALIAAIVG